MNIRRCRTWAWPLLVTLVAVGLSACATSEAVSSAHPRASLTTSRQLHDSLPAAIRARGVLRVITDASYPPASSFASDGRTIVGFEPDLGAALGKILGVRVIFADHDFADLPTIVRSGQADMIMSAMTDTAPREKTLDFVDYFSAGTSIVVHRGNPHGVSDLASLCGQTVAVEKGTVQADLLAREQAHCGTSPIHLLISRTNDDALLLVRTGRAAAVPMDFPPAELLTTSSRTSALYQLASTEQYEPGPYGIGLAKNQTALRDAVHTALGQLLRDGVYRQVLTKWHVATGALSAVSINLAGAQR